MKTRRECYREMSVIMFDLETTGFPCRNGLKFGEYHTYTNTPMYDTSRVVQISYMICNDDLDTMSMHDSIIDRCNDFEISNAHIHGITNEISSETGVDFQEVMIDFHKALKISKVLVAHNADFDVNILKAELYRRGMHDVLAELCTKKVVCTMKSTMYIVCARTMYNKVKYPTLGELYEFATHTRMEKAHNAKYDVMNMHEAVKILHDDGRCTSFN